MCLIIQTNEPKKVDIDLMECAYQNNSDGFGVMFYNNGKVHTHKIVPKSFKDINKVWDIYKDLDTPMGIHFRFTTEGETTRSLSHPFQVLNAKEHGRDLWVMHNGARLPTPMIDANKSDTHQFIKWILRPQLSNNPAMLYNVEWQDMLAETIGTDKMVFLDGKTKEFTIVNPQQGKDVQGVGWVSNTYSINRGVGFNYDINKGKKVPNTLYGNYGNGSIYNDRSYQYDFSYDKDMEWDWDTDQPKDRYGRQYAETSVDLAQPDDYALTDKDFLGATQEDVLDLVEMNPIGTAEWIWGLSNLDDSRGNK
jgi:hypothetical protein